MFKFISNQWKRLDTAVNQFSIGGKTLTQVINEGDAKDKLEIEQSNQVIVHHQYLKHMAEANVAAREAWRKLQEAAHGPGNVTPLLSSDQARTSKRH
jgi:hypothetical protein